MPHPHEHIIVFCQKKHGADPSLDRPRAARKGSLRKPSANSQQGNRRRILAWATSRCQPRNTWLNRVVHTHSVHPRNSQASKNIFSISSLLLVGLEAPTPVIRNTRRCVSEPFCGQKIISRQRGNVITPGKPSEPGMTLSCIRGWRAKNPTKKASLVNERGLAWV